MKNIIQISNLSKSFRIRTNTNVFSGLLSPKWRYSNAVESIDFSIQAGESVAFLGPNGAGKTTTTKMLTGLVKPSSGNVRVMGFEPFDRKAEFLKQIGLVMGNKAGLNWDLSAAQSFELLQAIYDIPLAKHRQRIVELSNILKVEHVLDKQVRKLSLGERMKLELVAALLHDPKILFLDEPTIGLDIESKQNIRKFLRNIHREGKTILLTSHDMDDVAEVCDRVIVINRGKIMFDGSMTSLTRQYAVEKFVRLEFAGQNPPAKVLERHGKIIAKNNGAYTIAMPKDSVMANIASIAERYTIHDITIEAVPLEVIVNDLFHKT